MARKNFITYVTGTQGIGKTYRTLMEAREYIKTDHRVGRTGRKVLIFDPNSEDDYKHFKTIPYNPTIKNDYQRTKYIRMYAASKTPEIRRIAPWVKGRMFSLAEKKRAALDIMSEFRLGLIILEDLTSYFQSMQDEVLVGTLVNVRHRGVDMIAHVQSLRRLRPVNWENGALVRFHYQTDSVDKYLDRVPNQKLLKMAQFIVNEQYLDDNIRFFCYINFEKQRLIGVTHEQFHKAAWRYFNLYPKEIKELEVQHGNNRSAAVDEWVKQYGKIYLRKPELKVAA